MDINGIMRKYQIVGNDSKFLDALKKAIQVAPTDLSIFITGESGVGKDVFSRIIHDFSNRKSRKLIPVNCGAIPEGTIESELFGHVKGSFTGADKNRKGYFEEASGGTIFLDEIGELPLAMQVKLLRVIENGEITPVGASQPVKVDVRIVAATNVNIVDAVKKGRFREDLYYRINQIPITIPPLRERKDDIPLLFRKFSSDVAERYKATPIFLNEEARQYLMQYPWNGNIRELKNITEQIAVIETERTITRPILQSYLNYVPEEMLPAIVSHGGNDPHLISDRELLLKALTMGQMINEMRSELNELKRVVTQFAQGDTLSAPISVTAIPSTTVSSAVTDIHESRWFGHADNEDDEWISPETVSEHKHEDDMLINSTEHGDCEIVTLEELEKRAIVDALERNEGRRKVAAMELGISERTLYRKISQYGLE